VLPAAGDADEGARFGLPGATSTGSSSCLGEGLPAGAASPRGAPASRPSTISEEENQYFE
jgi:hypothetical protein